MYSRDPYVRRTAGGFGGFGAPPIDVWILLGVVFVTFSLDHLLRPSAGPFGAGPGPLSLYLGLTPLVYKLGFVWQLATYPFVGEGAPGFWILLELFILYMFSRDVFRSVGRRNFWWLLSVVPTLAAVVAVGAELLRVATVGPAPAAFAIMQGQRMLLVVVIAAFATLYKDATIYLFFVLPIRAKWFLLLEILLAFMGFLGTGDFSGFLGIAAAVGLTYGSLTPGGVGRMAREWWLRFTRWRYEQELKLRRKKRSIHIVEDPDDDPDDSGDDVRRGPWVN